MSTPNDTKDAILKYLSERRMCSAENLATKFDMPLPSLSIILDELKNQDYIRTVNKSCGSSCDSCSTCGTDEIKDTLTSTTIIISLEKKENNNDR